VQEAVTALKSATAWAHRTEMLSRDPLSSYKRPKAPPSSAATSAWSPEESRAFLRSVENDRLRAAWWVLLGRGLRRGELLGLSWKDVDLRGGSLQIVTTRVVVGGEVVSSIPKTNAGRRSIPLDAHLVTVLKAHKARQAAEQLAAVGGTWEDSGFVFVDELGHPLRPETLSRAFTGLVTKAGLRTIRLHDLRHSCASLLLAGGEPVKVVSELLGHSHPMVTLGIYQHVLPTMGADAGERLTGLLTGSSES
jgi:integrase